MKIVTFEDNERQFEALLISSADQEAIEAKLPENMEFEPMEGIEGVYELCAHGDEPLGAIQSFLGEAIGWDMLSDKLPTDLGYDTDIDGVGYNAIYIKVEN